MYSLLNNGKVRKENEIGEGLVVSDDVLEEYIRTYIYKQWFLLRSESDVRGEENEWNELFVKTYVIKNRFSNKYLTIN
jgi:hypothetical protein